MPRLKYTISRLTPDSSDPGFVAVSRASDHRDRAAILASGLPRHPGGPRPGVGPRAARVSGVEMTKVTRRGPGRG